MRASELLGARVVDADGTPVGVVTGLHCVPGPGRGDRPAPPRLDGLRVSPHGWAAALGYQEEGQRGPWLVRRAVGLLLRGVRVVAWDDVTEVEDGVVHIDDRSSR